MVEWMWYGKLKLWKLTKIGRKQLGVQFRPIKNLKHTLSIADLYFLIPHHHFAFEPQCRYQETYLEPDAIIYGERDGKKFLWCFEVQLTDLTKKLWAKKWEKYNTYFNDEKYFKTAPYQNWLNGKIARPSRFIVLTKQSEQQVSGGFDVDGKKLEVKSEWKSLVKS